MLLSLRFCYFSFVWFSPPPSFFFLVPRVASASLPWCLFLIVLVVVFFAPASVLSPSVLPCSVAVALWLAVFCLVRISGSCCEVVSLWDESGLLRPLSFLGFELPVCAGILSAFVSAPFLCLFRIWNSLCVVFTWWVAFVFLGAQSRSVLVLPEVFLVPTRSCSFRPSGSSLMSFHCCSLWSLLPFSSQFFVASLRLLFSVRGSLYPFLGRSSSLPSPPLCLPASGSFSFGLRLVQLCTFLGGWVTNWFVSLRFLFALSFVHEVLLCFLSSFRISPFRLSLPWSVVSFHLVPSGFVLPHLFPDFSVGLFIGSLVYPLVWFVSPLDVSFLARSKFLVPPRLVFSPFDVVGTFVYILHQVVLFLVSRHCPAGSCPSCGVPCHFFCGAVISLTSIRGFSCIACVFFHSASSIFAFAPWRLCRRYFRIALLCPVCTWSLSLARLDAFLQVFVRFCFPSFFSRTFSAGTLSFFAFSPLGRLPLLLVLRVLCLLLVPASSAFRAHCLRGFAASCFFFFFSHNAFLSSFLLATT